MTAIFFGVRVMKTLRLTSNDRAILLNSSFLGRLPRSTSEAIIEDATVSTHEEHDVLFRQGDSIDEAFVVLSGLVRLYRVGKDGREADLAVLQAGEVFAESAIFLGHHATASARAPAPPSATSSPAWTSRGMPPP